MKMIFGFDIGTTSIGWAVILLDEATGEGSIIAMGPAVTQQLSRYWQDKENARKPVLFPPWSKLREQATAKVREIVVSHRVQKKLSGGLHKETILGGTDLVERSGKVISHYFTHRKSLLNISKGELEDIRDPHLREVVADWVAKRGGDPKYHRNFDIWLAAFRREPATRHRKARSTESNFAD